MRNVEQPVIGLAEMARAVGMHLAPATRVDSRTALDVMETERLPGRRDMPFLPRI